MIATTASADGTSIAYEQFGDGPAVIVVGGALMDRSSPARLVELLAEHFTMFTYDRRGRGDSSDTAPYAVEREFEDLAALIAVAGGRAGVFGMSSGGFIALHTAATVGKSVVRVAVYEPPYLTGHEAGQLSAHDYASRLRSHIAAENPDQAVELFLRHVSGGHFDDSISRSPWWPARWR